MGDECTCEKCQASSLEETGVYDRVFVHAERPTEGHARTQRKLYMVVTDGDNTLRQLSCEK
jgi:hypothetical protein